MRRFTRHIRSTGSAVACIAVVLGLVSSPAAGGAPSLTIAVQPTELVLPGAARGTFTVINPTSSRVSLNASLGNYLIRANGKVVIDPSLPPQRSAKKWLTYSPSHFDLAPHERKQLTVSSRPAIPPNLHRRRPPCTYSGRVSRRCPSYL